MNMRMNMIKTNIIRTLVLKDLKLKKKRTIVMIVAIILSTALLSALASLVTSFRMSLIEFEKDRDGDFHYAFSEVTPEGLADLQKNRAIDSVFVTDNIGYARIDNASDDTKPYAFIAGMDKKAQDGARLKMLEGRMPENENEIAVPRHLKTKGRVSYNMGDSITLDVGKRENKKTGAILGQDASYLGSREELVKTQSRTFVITGIFEQPGVNIESPSAAGYTFVTYEASGAKAAAAAADTMTVYARYTKAGLRDRWAVTAGILGADPDLYERGYSDERIESDPLTGSEEEKLVGQLANAPYSVRANKWLMNYESLWPLGQSMRIVAGIASIVAVVIILTSIYCIKNGFDISISEKIRQYGMLASMGATKKQIKKSVRLQAFMLGAAGIPAGIMSGLLAAVILIKLCNVMLFDSAIGMKLIFDASAVMILAAALLAAVTVYLSASGSARRASKATPLDALRNSKEIKIKPGKLRTPKYITKLWGVSGALAYKNMKRSSRKYRTTVVSVILCTAAFISVSYFMSIGMRMVELDVGKMDYNIDVVMTQPLDNEALADEFRMIDDSDEFTVSTTIYMSAAADHVNKSYRAYLEKSQDPNGSITAAITALDDASFKKYAESIGLADENAGAILVNNNIVSFEDDNGKPKSAESDVFDIKAGERLKLYYSDTDAKDCRYSVDIGAVTRERPLGFRNSYGPVYIIMSGSMFRSFGYETAIKEGAMKGYQDVYCMAGDADGLQDRIEKGLLAGSKWSGESFQVTNMDKSMRTMKSFYTLLAVFAYGLIAVIALIGVTNIINTLGTGMELRRREFATLKSIGMTRGQFNRMISLESLFISIRSLVIGIPVGIEMSYIMCAIQNSSGTAVAYRPPIAACIMCAAVVTLVIWGIMRSSMTKLGGDNIIDAVKNENM